MACIYKIKNTVNGKIYIGKTVKELRKRITAHKTDSKRISNAKNPLYQDALKYGWDVFQINVLAEGCFSSEDLNNLEKEYISKYDCLMPKGYNQNTGGDEGFTWCEEYKQNKKGTQKNPSKKISNIMKEKWKDPKYRESMSNAHKGKRTKKYADYVTKLTRLNISKDEFIQDYHNGLTNKEMQIKYNTGYQAIKLRLDRWIHTGETKDAATKN